MNRQGDRLGLIYKKLFSTGIQFLGFFSLGFFTKDLQNDSAAYQYPTALPILVNEGYTVAYDGRTKLPYWTYEHLTSKVVNRNVRREECSFVEDSRIYPLHRSRLSDYKGSGFDRGHMVPAADQKHSKQSLQETFFLSNICPQVPLLNRKFWLNLEKHIRSLCHEYESVDVITGPLFLPNIEKNGKRYVMYEVIGENSVAVPTHFFKVIIVDEKQWIYVVPNREINQDESFEDFLISSEDFEKISGLSLGLFNSSSMENLQNSTASATAAIGITKSDLIQENKFISKKLPI